ncbi:hypothetical protein [Streptococcus equi]|nr:hypothetical protein [Streptococcus equi]
MTKMMNKWESTLITSLKNMPNMPGGMPDMSALEGMMGKVFT